METDGAVARPPRRSWPWVLLVLAAGAAAVVGLFAYDAYRLQGAADALVAHAGAARVALSAQDIASLRVEVAEVEEAARTFEQATHGPHWWVAARVPWVSDQVVPLRVAGEAVGAVAEDALRPLAELDDLEALAGPQFDGGRIDPYVLEPYRPALTRASAALTEQGEALESVDLSGTVEPLREPFEDLGDQVETLRDLVDGARVTAELLPTMLGADGERRYVVVVQNNAEPRATGGLPGAFLELTVDDGRFALGDYKTAQELEVRDGVAPLTADEERIYTYRMAFYPHDANLTPEFPRTAELVSAFWTDETGQAVDGVLSIDPIALGWMIEGASPIDVAGVEITSANLASLMLNEAYFLFDDPDAQDVFFLRAAGALFSSIASGQTASLGGVERAIDARRFLVWSARDDEQEILEGTSASGTFLGDADVLGVFLNDGSGSKIGYYVDTELTVTDRLCTDGTLEGQEVELTLTHTFDGDVDGLPAYVTGLPQFVPAGEFHVNVVVYPAAGTEAVAVVRDGDNTEVASDTHDGRAMSQKRVVLEPGARTTLTYTLEATDDARVPPRIVLTPGPREVDPRRVTEAAGC